MKLSCALAVLLLGQNIAAAPLSEVDDQDLRVYIEEVDRLFKSLPGWNEPEPTSSKDTISQEVEELVQGRAKTRMETIPVDRSDDKSERSGKKTVTIVRTTTSRYVVGGFPFFIDQKPKSSEDSDECLRDRSHVTATYQKCISSQAEVDRSMTSSAEDNDPTVGFLRQCRRTPQIRQCIKESILDRLEGCLDEGLHETISHIEIVTESVTKFICKYEADRIAMFLRDGGPTCWKDIATSSRILFCLNANIASHVFNSLFDVPSLKMVADMCLHLELADKCVLQEMESCRDDLSVLVAGVFFSVAKQVASCGERLLQQRVTPEYVGTTGRSQPITTATTVVPHLTLAQVYPVLEPPEPSLVQSEVFVAVLICTLIIISAFVAIIVFKKNISRTEQRCNYAVEGNVSTVQNTSS